METSPEILVFGVTGQQGGAVARALRSEAKAVRGFVRDSNSKIARALVADGISLAVGDLYDRASIDRAMVGIRSAFSVQTSSPSGTLSDEDEVTQGKNVADSAAAAGVSHFVYSSGGAAGKGLTGMGHFDSKSRIEDYVRTQPFASTITRPASFVEMMMLPGMGLNTGTFSYFMRPEQSMQMITLRDLGRINAHILLHPKRYTGKALELSGQSITGNDLERAFTQAAGRPIRYQRFSDELLSQNTFLRDLTALVDNGVVAGVADIDALVAEFGPMLSLEDWLAGPGKPLFSAALNAQKADIALH